LPLKIADLRSGMDRITIIGYIRNVTEKRIVETRFGSAYKATATLEDETGRITLNLWRGQIDAVKAGDVVRIENGFVGSFKGNLELNVGSRGRIVVL